MKALAPKKMTVDQLIQWFADLAVLQDHALVHDDTAKFNRLFDQMEAIKLELKRRPGDQRKQLLRLFSDSNMQVRLTAARAALAVEPKAARELTEEIATSAWFPQAGDAGMTLWALDQGIFKPT